MTAAFIARYPFRRWEPWALAALAGSIWLWFGVDSAASIAQGAFFNVLLLNLLCVALMNISLVALLPQFRKDRGCPSYRV